MIRNEIMECVSPLSPRLQICHFWPPLLRCTYGAERAVQWQKVQLSSGTGYAGYTSASFTRMGEKPTANLLCDLHKILRLSGIPMRPSRKSSGIVKKYSPSECVTLKAHTLINWPKISPIKIVHLDFVEDHIAHPVWHLQVQEDI